MYRYVYSRIVHFYIRIIVVCRRVATYFNYVPIHPELAACVCLPENRTGAAAIGAATFCAFAFSLCASDTGLGCTRRTLTFAACRADFTVAQFGYRYRINYRVTNRAEDFFYSGCTAGCRGEYFAVLCGVGVRADYILECFVGIGVF